MKQSKHKTYISPDIILVRVVDRSMRIFKRIGAVQHPMNLIYLATYLRKHGYIPEIIDLEVEPFSLLEKRLKSSQPYLVGITVMTANVHEAKRICILCRSMGIKTVLGGSHPTALPVLTLKDTGCDYVIIGEGEKPLVNLLDKLKENCPVDDVKGIAFLQNGVPIVNERPQFVDLNELPLPDRRFVKLDLYAGETSPGILGKGAVIFTLRGCPYACTFCASKVINQQRVRFRSMENIFEEIDDIVALGFSHLTIEDDTFTLNSQRVKEFCVCLISKYPQLSWDCDSRVDTLNDELLGMMKKSHCKKIAFGVETGSTRILRSINKGIEIRQVKEAFNLAKKHKILTQAFFIIGFPEETQEDIEATEKLIDEINPDILVLSIAIPYPGTDLYNYMLKKGLIVSMNWDSFVYFGERIPCNTEYFNGKELVEIRKRINLKFYFRPSYILRNILSIRSLKGLRYLIKCVLVAFRAFF